MGRSEDADRCPLRFYLNLSKAVVTNVFLNLYPKPFLGKLLEENNNRPLELLRSLQAITCTQVVEEGRSYGGGLHKLEPREMGNVGLYICSRNGLWLSLKSNWRWYEQVCGGAFLLITGGS